MRTRGGRPLRLGGPFRPGFDLLWLSLLIGRLLFGRAFGWRLALRRVGRRLFLGRRRWLGRLRLPGANAEQPLEQARLSPLSHGALTASKETPSSPEATASTSAPAPSCGGPWRPQDATSEPQRLWRAARLRGARPCGH